MDFTPNEDLKQIAESVQAACRSFDETYWSACESDHRFPWEFYERMAKGGWLGVAIPQEYDGGGGGITEAAIVLFEVAASGAGMNGCSALHLTIFGLNPVVRFGTERLKRAFLPRAAAGDLHVAFGVTEPDAGTDTSRVATRAERTRNGDYLVRGRKIWTTKALESEVVLLLVRTGPGSGLDGLSLLLADLDPKYVDIRPIPKMARNAVASCEVVYDALPVPGWRLVGEEGKGWRYLLHGINPERILLAAESIGIGRVALDRAVRYASDRRVFDRPIGSNQAIAHPLAKAHVQLTWCYDNGVDCGEAANSAKFLAADAAFFAADSAVQTHGGMGFATEYHVERYFREARLQRLVPISQEMTLNYIAQHVLGLPKSY